ncbi:hypothetical protein GCK72_006964 [Caenorhabditis remanei]|uniref:Uncharacterized protein n=1 Tax=Caenorhabditis remanei TaxID=31234 RepID=A0A6A5HJZ6_CAERE|nr:hypothetical protein GCK72_006964 [Caenorhabditis remanei]KAF1767006.1 hypothetical protein GCK72_006964 [Caenorhabditis remanei]
METEGGAIQQQQQPHHRGEHSKNHHHQERLLGQTATSSIQGFQPFTGSLFDTPPSMFSSCQPCCQMTSSQFDHHELLAFGE